MVKQDWINSEMNKYLNSEKKLKKGFFENFKNKRKHLGDDIDINITEDGGSVVIKADPSFYQKAMDYFTGFFKQKKEEETEEESKNI